MWIYILILLGVTALMFGYDYFEKKAPSKLSKFFKFATVVLTIAIFVIFFTLRDISVGVDTTSYRKIYKYLQSHKDFQTLKNFDIFYSILNIVCYEICPDFTFLLLVVSVIMFTNFVISIIKLSGNRPISMAIFVGIGFYAQTFNMLRQMMAISFVMIGLVFLIKSKHKWLYFVFVGIATLFHITALVCVLIYLLYVMKLNKTSLIVIAVLTIIGCFVFPYALKLCDALFDKNFYANYFNNQFAIATWKNIAFIAFCILATLFALWYRKFLTKKNIDIKEYDLYCLMFIGIVAIKIVSLFTIELLDRIIYYLIPSAFFIVPIIFNSFSKKTKLILEPIIVVSLIIFMWYFLQIRETFGVYPYKFAI